MWRVLVVGLVAVALPVAVGSAQPEKYVSWGDPAHRYGWTDVQGGPPAFAGDPEPDPFCKGARAGGTTSYICATENGGRTWHRVFQAGNGLQYLLGYTRTSRTAGIASIGREDRPRTLRNAVFWTVDNGRHWYETTRIGRNVEGRGRQLFWSDRFSKRLYQVRPWPPVRKPRCRGLFAWHPQDQRRRKDGTVCVGARENAGMRSHLVARIPPEDEFARFWAWRATPRGVIALIGPVLPLRILTRADEENRIQALARPPVPAGSFLSDARLEGEWPSFRLLGTFHSGERFAWRSTDGGSTWTIPERA